MVLVKPVLALGGFACLNRRRQAVETAQTDMGSAYLYLCLPLTVSLFPDNPSFDLPSCGFQRLQLPLQILMDPLQIEAGEFRHSLGP